VAAKTPFLERPETTPAPARGEGKTQSPGVNRG
jgi:hypothetical protein